MYCTQSIKYILLHYIYYTNSHIQKSCSCIFSWFPLPWEYRNQFYGRILTILTLAISRSIKNMEWKKRRIEGNLYKNFDEMLKEW